VFSRDELADSLGLFGDGCRDKGVGFREGTLPDAVRPFFPFLWYYCTWVSWGDEGATCGCLSIMGAFSVTLRLLLAVGLAILCFFRLG